MEFPHLHSVDGPSFSTIQQSRLYCRSVHFAFLYFFTYITSLYIIIHYIIILLHYITLYITSFTYIYIHYIIIHYIIILLHYYTLHHLHTFSYITSLHTLYHTLHTYIISYITSFTYIFLHTLHFTRIDTCRLFHSLSLTFPNTALAKPPNQHQEDRVSINHQSFNYHHHYLKNEISIGTEPLVKCKTFKYLGSTVSENARLEYELSLRMGRASSKVYLTPYQINRVPLTTFVSVFCTFDCLTL